MDSLTPRVEGNVCTSGKSTVGLPVSKGKKYRVNTYGPESAVKILGAVRRRNIKTEMRI